MAECSTYMCRQTDRYTILQWSTPTPVNQWENFNKMNSHTSTGLAWAVVVQHKTYLLTCSFCPIPPSAPKSLTRVEVKANSSSLRCGLTVTKYLDKVSWSFGTGSFGRFWARTSGLVAVELHRTCREETYVSNMNALLPHCKQKHGMKLFKCYFNKFK